MDQNAKKAPSVLIHNGQYSDERFIDIMAAHHAIAIDMAKIAKDKAEHTEIQNLADNVIADQAEEIKKLSRIKKDNFGTDQVATEPHENERSMHGMASNEELKKAKPFDKAFIRNQLPHHASAIEMASVAAMETQIDDIREMSYQIMQAQAEEISNMINWHKTWYGELSGS